MIPKLKSEGYSRDGIRLYPMDGGGSSSSGGGTQIQELPEWARPYAKSTLEKGAALSERGYQAYNQPRIAGFSPMQQQAQQNAANMQTSGATGAGIDVAAEVAGRGLGTNYQAVQFQNQIQAPDPYQAGRFRADRIGTQSFAQPGAAESYMSPYMQNVVDVQQREARRASDIARQGQQAQAVGAGAFGGSRQGLVEAERQRNLATQLGDIQATGQQAAFTQAQQQFNADQARRLAAQQANQQYGLQAQQLGEQSRQFGAGQGLQAASLGAQYGQAANQLGEQSRQYGAGLGLQGLQTALQGAGQLGALGGQQFQQGMDINKLQSAYGGQQQALRQQGLTQAYEDFQNEQNYPYKQLGFFSDLIRGLPLGQQTAKSMYEPAPNAAQQIGALGMGAYGLSKFMAEGGMAYADGGSVDSADNVERIVSRLSDQQLQQAMQAAQARGDADQLEAIQSEMAMRASERRGVAAGITPQMADRMAGGGIVAFAGDEEENDPIGGQLVLGAPNKEALREWMEAQKAIKEFKPRAAMTPAQRDAMDKANYERYQKFAGEDPYAPMAERLKGYEADRTKSLEESKGLAALQAIPAMLQGRGIRGIASGVGALGGNLAQVAKSDAAEKRALGSMQFNLADAQRKERMGLTKSAIEATSEAQKDQIAADKAALEALKARSKGATDAGRAFRTTGAGGAGAPKPLKLAEQLAAAEVEHETNPSDATLKKVTGLRRAMDRSRTTDVGTQKAALARESILARETEGVRNAMSEFMYSPKFLTADAQGKGQEAFDAELERQRSLKPALNTPVNRNSGNNTPPPPPGFTPN